MDFPQKKNTRATLLSKICSSGPEQVGAQQLEAGLASSLTQHTRQRGRRRQGP